MAGVPLTRSVSLFGWEDEPPRLRIKNDMVRSFGVSVFKRANAFRVIADTCGLEASGVCFETLGFGLNRGGMWV